MFTNIGILGDLTSIDSVRSNIASAYTGADKDATFGFGMVQMQDGKANLGFFEVTWSGVTGVIDKDSADLAVTPIAVIKDIDVSVIGNPLAAGKMLSALNPSRLDRSLNL